MVVERVSTAIAVVLFVPALGRSRGVVMVRIDLVYLLTIFLNWF